MATFTIGAGNLLDSERQKIEVLNWGEESFKHDLQEITEGVQADRAAALLQSRELQLAVQLVFQAEAARIGRFAPDDLRVAAFTRGGQQALERAEMLEREAGLASVRVPMIKKTEALLHGRVTDEQDRAAGPVMVTLVDAQGKAVAGVAPVEADSAGYYALVVPAEVAGKLSPDSTFAVALALGEQRIPPKAEAVSLTGGVVRLQDIRLNETELQGLKLRAERVFSTEPMRPPRRSAPTPAPRQPPSRKGRSSK